MTRHPPSDPTLASLREQVRQLDASRDAGALEADAHALARAALERRIVDAVLVEQGQGRAARASKAGGLSVRLIVGLTLWGVIVAAGGYFWLGKSPAPRTAALAPAAGTNPAPAAGENTTPAPHALGKDQMAAMIQTLSGRLKENPEDFDGWAMLARSHAVLGEHANAVTAFRRAQALRQDDPVLLADFADALAMVNGRRLEGEPTKLIERALVLDPVNLKALSLAGTAAFDRKDYAGALRHWESLQSLAPPDNPLALQVRGGMEEARQLAGIKSADAPGSTRAKPAAASPVAQGVGGTVMLSAALAARAAPEDTLFVFARAAQGPRMPLAILRRQVKDLPLRFSLDDSQAMSPDTRLSGFPQVVVGARISKSGLATPQAGDLQGQSEEVALGRTDLRIEITEVVSR